MTGSEAQWRVNPAGCMLTAFWCNRANLQGEAWGPSFLPYAHEPTSRRGAAPLRLDQKNAECKVMSSVRRRKLPRTDGTEGVIPWEGFQSPFQINGPLNVISEASLVVPSSLTSHRCGKATKEKR